MSSLLKKITKVFFGGKKAALATAMEQLIQMCRTIGQTAGRERGGTKKEGRDDGGRWETVSKVAPPHANLSPPCC